MIQFKHPFLEILLVLSFFKAGATSIGLDEPGSSTSRRAHITTTYNSKTEARDSLAQSLKDLGYKITSISKNKVEGFKMRTLSNPLFFSGPQNEILPQDSKKGGVGSLLHRKPLSERKYVKTPFIRAKIESHGELIFIDAISKNKRHKVESLTDLEELAKQLSIRDIKFL